MVSPDVKWRSGSVLTIAVGFACMLLPASISFAQEERGTIVSNDSMSTATVQLEAYRTDCPERFPDVCGYNYPISSRSCSVVAVDSLGVRGERSLHLARYLRSVTYQESETETWRCESDAAFLVEVSSDSTARPVWIDEVERTFEFIRDPEITVHGDEDVFSVLYCLNGTGGCYENLLIRRHGGWHFLGRDSTWNRVYDQLPAGYRLHKSPRIDLQNLTWERHIAGPNDANCCPSGRILLELDIVDGRLSVRKARLEADLSLDR